MYNPSSRDSSKLAPFSNIREAIAERMVWSWKNIPHFQAEAQPFDMTRVWGFREGLGENAPPWDCFFVWALKHVIPLNPVVNAGCFESSVSLETPSGPQSKPWFFYEPHEEINIGIAVHIELRSGEGALVVPVLKHVENMKFLEMVNAFQELVLKAKAGKCSLKDFEEGTITLNNLGAIGSYGGFSIINPPQSTIISFGRVIKTPLANGDDVVVRPLCKVSISGDHRLYDGQAAMKFLNDLKSFMEFFPSHDALT